MYALGALLTVLLLAVLFALAYLVLPAYRTQLTFSRQGIPCAPFIPVIGKPPTLAASITASSVRPSPPPLSRLAPTL